MPLDKKSIHSPEIEQVKKLRDCFKKNPLQVNRLNSSDCEVIKFGNQYLVSNLDTVSEEVELGLYKDPKTIGRIAAVSCLSDLAACGIKPNHIMQSVTWSREYTDSQKLILQQAYSDVLDLYNIQLSGGDTSEGPFTTITSLAQALSDKAPLSRYGAKDGDLVCLTGHLGDGPALAMSYLLGLKDNDFKEEDYNPKAYINAGNSLYNFATASIDTSDGLITALNHLKNINSIEFDLVLNAPLYSEKSMLFINDNSLDLFLLWIVEHGDYQLLTIIPPENIDKAKKEIEHLSVIGKVTTKKRSSLNTGTQIKELNLTELCQSLFSRRYAPSEHLKELNAKLKGNEAI